MKRLVFVAAILFLWACTGSTGVVESDVVEDVGGVDSLTPDNVAGRELGQADGQVQPPEEVFDFGEVPDEQGQPLCEAGEGCFLDPCGENSDCQSGWCVEHMGENVCTIECTEECPPGWGCQQIGGGPDLSFVCVSNVSNLCKPCAVTSDCKSPGGAEDVCLQYGEEGSFCGAACTTDDECPWGFSCLTTITVDGVSTLQCAADAGVCPCAAKSVALGLSTPCEQSNEAGSCSGKRTCTEAGLGECDASLPAEETCNGIDDDCDGVVDVDADGGRTGDEMCEDDNPCTVDSCEGDVGCQYEVLEEGECLDGDACTIGDHCEAGVCIGMAIQCDDSDPCTDDACDGLGGCSHSLNEAECDDEDPCTVADRCAEGVCGGVVVPCDCQETADCGALEDGDLCNGVLYCDKLEWPFECRVNGDTLIVCPEPEGMDGPCLAAACDADSGECSLVAAAEGAPCDDGDPCTLADSCVEGACTGGPTPICKDDNLCTDDGCEAGVGCSFTPNSLPCNDGDVCTTEDVCAGGACVGGAALSCDDGDLCNGAESCDSNIGCEAGEPLDCDDGDLCNGVEFCFGPEGCKSGLALECGDNDPCNGEESCDGQLGCLLGTPLVCGDDNLCNGQEYCEEGSGCQAGEELDCNDLNPCTDDSCDGMDGCIHTLNDKECDDGNACTVGDKCNAGECVYGGLQNCDDDNPCTNDSCDPATGCLHLLNTAPCNDGNQCTLDDVCVLGECAGSGEFVCDDGNPCTAGSCDPDSGCQFVPQEGECDDGNACTDGDQCQAGSCLGPIPVSCNDDNLCTVDICLPVGGCTFENVVVPCDDADPCTINDICAEGVCEGGGAADCDDENVCTSDSCESGVGCAYAPEEGSCDDGSACTDDDVCVAGGCVGTPISCDDSDSCTADSCNPDSGCVYVPATPCCGNGEVEDGEVCDDGNTDDGDSCQGDCQSYAPLNIKFTTCGATGPAGPSQGACMAEYLGKPGLEGKVTVASGIQLWTAPYTGSYRITAAGAVTNGGSAAGGYGAIIRGDVELASGTQLKVLVGQTGTDKLGNGWRGGSGGSFVATNANAPVMVGGGGGGYDTRYGLCSGVHGSAGNDGYATCSCASTHYSAGTNGNGGGGAGGNAGGGGFNTDGNSDGDAARGRAFVNGGAGGTANQGDGGFGGGSGTGDDQGGSGGGYSGGGGCGDDGHGGGGGSYNSGINQSNQSGQNSGQGYVIIEFLG
jgi:hypothetical protein